MPHYMGYWKINDFKRTWQRHIWPRQPHVPKKVFTEFSLRFHSSGIRDHLISLGDRVLARRRARKVDIKTGAMLLTGAILFFVTGIISFINYFNGVCLDNVAKKTIRYKDYYDITAIINAILSVVVCILMIVDILKTENILWTP